MNQINCLIIDDEPVARKVIRELIDDVDFLQVSGEAENPVIANNLLMEFKPDLIFLDIDMPKMNGIDFLKSIQQPPMIIITTAYPDFAMQGFELDVLDYLVKPVGVQRFLKAVNKAQDFHTMKHKRHELNTGEFFFVKCDQKIEKIMLEDVLYIESLDNYIIIYTVQRKYLVYLTLKAIEEELPQNAFLRIHKSYLVSFKAIRTIDGNEIVIGQNTRIPISKNHKEQVMERIETRFLKR